MFSVYLPHPLASSVLPSSTYQNSIFIKGLNLEVLIRRDRKVNISKIKIRVRNGGGGYYT